MPSSTSFTRQAPYETLYAATDFTHFSSKSEEGLIARGAWTREDTTEDTIPYRSEVRFADTAEDVSAIYGNAVVYMLQWERDGFCPQVEQVANDCLLYTSPSPRD